MEFKKGISELKRDGQLKAFADRCDTTEGYIVTHLLKPRKIPRGELMTRLWQESKGLFSRDDVLAHFFPKDS